MTGDLIFETRRIPAVRIAEWRQSMHRFERHQSNTIYFLSNGEFLSICNYFQEEFLDYIETWGQSDLNLLDRKHLLTLHIESHQAPNHSYKPFWKALGSKINGLKHCCGVEMKVSDHVALVSITSELKNKRNYAVLWLDGLYENPNERLEYEQALLSLQHCESLKLLGCPWELCGVLNSLVTLSTEKQFREIVIRISLCSQKAFKINTLVSFFSKLKCQDLTVDTLYSCDESRLLLAGAFEASQRGTPFEVLQIGWEFLDDSVIQALSRTNLIQDLFLLGDRQQYHLLNVDQGKWMSLLVRNVHIRRFGLKGVGMTVESLQCFVESMRVKNYSGIITPITFDNVTVDGILNLFKHFSMCEHLVQLTVDGDIDAFVGDNMDLRQHLVSELTRILSESKTLQVVRLHHHSSSKNDWLDGRLEPYLKLNRCGRDYLGREAGDRNAAIELLGHPLISSDLDCLFSHLVEHPEIIYAVDKKKRGNPPGRIMDTPEAIEASSQTPTNHHEELVCLVNALS